MAKLLIKNIELLHTPNGEMQNIAVEDNKIVYVGKDVPADFAADEIVDGKGKLATAGMVNTHGHVSMTLLRSYADDMALMDWLQNKIWPIEDKMDANDIYWGAMLGIVEMLKGGTTCFADMYAFMEDVARACAETGIRANLSRGLIGQRLAAGTVQAGVATTVFSDTEAATYFGRGSVLHQMARAAIKANRIVGEMGIQRRGLVEEDLAGYKIPFLEGIWLRGPYLHNGSVPSLRDLLEAPAARPRAPGHRRRNHRLSLCLDRRGAAGPEISRRTRPAGNRPAQPHPRICDDEPRHRGRRRGHPRRQ